MDPMLSPQTMRLILLLTLIGMQLLAVFYLRRRRMTTFAYLGWGLVAILVPAVGPFFVILWQPGQGTQIRGKTRLGYTVMGS
jgi:hypothetical protein